MTHHFLRRLKTFLAQLTLYIQQLFINKMHLFSLEIDLKMTTTEFFIGNQDFINENFFWPWIKNPNRNKKNCLIETGISTSIQAQMMFSRTSFWMVCNIFQQFLETKAWKIVYFEKRTGNYSRIKNNATKVVGNTQAFQKFCTVWARACTHAPMHVDSLLEAAPLSFNDYLL